MAKNLVNGSSTTIEENGGNISIQINFPIGYIYLSTDSTNPSTYFGGTWQRISKGRMLVGVDENDTDFSSSEIQGGNKTHSHYSGVSAYNSKLAISNTNSDASHPATEVYNVNGTTGFTSVGSQNVFAYSTESANGMNPYFTCYIWEKVGV